MPDESAAPTIEIEVVYAERDRQLLRALRLPAGSTVAQAIDAAGIRELVPSGAPCAIGIFGRLVQADDVLNDGDRVELYRPLRLDPKEARRRRAKTGSKVQVRSEK